MGPIETCAASGVSILVHDANGSLKSELRSAYDGSFKIDSLKQDDFVSIFYRIGEFREKIVSLQASELEKFDQWTIHPSSEVDKGECFNNEEDDPKTFTVSADNSEIPNYIAYEPNTSREYFDFNSNTAHFLLESCPLCQPREPLKKSPDLRQ